MRTRTSYSITLAILFFSVLLCGCDRLMRNAQYADTTGSAGSDSLGALARRMEGRARSYERVLEEKDTLIETLQTAMVLLNELSSIEREIVAGRIPTDEVGPEPWDQRVRRQLQRLRERYDELANELSAAEQRLRTLEKRDATTRASLADALRTAAALREDNERKQEMIDELTQRVALLVSEKEAAVALSVARADTIQALAEENNTVYWVAGPQEQLRAMGLVETVGGRHIVFTRVGESLAPAREFDTSRFQAIDRRRVHRIALPDNGEYEILTRQDISLADPATLRRDGDRWIVRGELRIADPRFWSPTPFLILLRR